MNILNLSKFEILYVSQNFTRLTGITNADLTPNPRKIFTQILHPKELPIVLQAYTKTIRFYTKLYQGESKKLYVDANYYVKIRSQAGVYKDFCLLIHPVYFSEAGYPILSYVLFLPGIKYGFEKFSISVRSNDKRLYYSALSDKYVQRKNLELKDVEIEILKSTAKGYGENKIAKSLDIKLDLVRYYKKSIYKKYHVTTMAEAVFIALQDGII